MIVSNNTIPVPHYDGVCVTLSIFQEFLQLCHTTLPLHHLHAPMLACTLASSKYFSQSNRASLILSKFFIYQLMHKRTALKRILKFPLKQLQHVSVQSPSSGSVLVQPISIPFSLFSKSYCYSLDTTFFHCRPNNTSICSHTTKLTTPMYFN